MTKLSVLIRDRESGGIASVRIGAEPVKLRVCRSCGRVHDTDPAACANAA